MSKQSIIGLVLMFLVLLGFSYWQTTKMDKQRRQLAEQMASEAAESTDTAAFDTLNGAVASQPGIQDLPAKVQGGGIDRANPFSACMQGEDRYFEVENEVFKIRFLNKGGRIAGITLKDYLTYRKEDLVLMNENLSEFYLQFFANNRNVRTDRCYFECLMPSATQVAGNDSIVVRMRLYPDNLTDSSKTEYLEFAYTVRGNSYMLGFDVNFAGMQDVVASNTSFIDLVWNARLEQLEKSLQMESMNTAVYYKPLNDKVRYLKETRDDAKSLTTPSKWISFKQQFFSLSLIADKDFSSAEIRNYTQKAAPAGYLKDLEAVIGLPYDGQDYQTIGMNIYAGPNKYRTLRDFGLDLERQIPLGWSFFLMQWINRVAVIPVFDFLESKGLHYGLIILILTILLKIVLFPLTYKSYASSAKMRVIQPEVAEINKKYPKPEQAMDKQRATMALYKKAGISPLSGCIPMLLQFPIVLAMFRFLPASIELRQKSFLWADDLSAYDSVLNLSFNIPFYGNHISLFALLMAISNLLYTHMTMKQQAQTNQMPGMKFMMYFMPVMLLCFLNSYASGLNYYYCLSMFITFLQMFFIRRMIDDRKVLAKIQENKKKPVKKSKFQQRLEEMAKRQQEIARQQASQRRR
ncbi:MAG: membrane protein insertase YidC [Bacteroides sp.]|nr:membrane protein insertase YidC [Bacteroides sp.]MCM1086344.1 membrane protein insertase YidC [Bacteroides sp.]